MNGFVCTTVFTLDGTLRENDVRELAIRRPMGHRERALSRLSLSILADIPVSLLVLG